MNNTDKRDFGYLLTYLGGMGLVMSGLWWTLMTFGPAAVPAIAIVCLLAGIVLAKRYG